MPSITINFSAEAAARIATALERVNVYVDENNEPRPADAGDVKNFLKDKLARFVRDSERQQARANADASVTDVELT